MLRGYRAITGECPTRTIHVLESLFTPNYRSSKRPIKSLTSFTPVDAPACVLNQRRNGTVWAKSVEDTILFWHKFHYRILGIWFPLNRDMHELGEGFWQVGTESIDVTYI
jgi:hypothetical protein